MHLNSSIWVQVSFEEVQGVEASKDASPQFWSETNFWGWAEISSYNLASSYFRAF
jgi:hypothetical protein